MKTLVVFAVMAGLCTLPVGAQLAERSHGVVLHAARMLDVAGGRIVTPGEVLVEGDRIVATGAHVDRPAGAEVIDLGDDGWRWRDRTFPRWTLRASPDGNCHVCVANIPVCIYLPPRV